MVRAQEAAMEIFDRTRHDSDRFLHWRSTYPESFVLNIRGKSCMASIMASATPGASGRGQSTSAPKDKGVRGLRCPSAWPHVADAVIEASCMLHLASQPTHGLDLLKNEVFLAQIGASFISQRTVL